MLNTRGMGRRSVVAALLVSAALVAGCGGQELEPLPEQPSTETTPTEGPQELGQQEEEAPEGEEPASEPEIEREYDAEGNVVLPDRGPSTDEINVDYAGQAVIDYFNAYLDALYTGDATYLWRNGDQGCIWCGSRIRAVDRMGRESLRSETPRSAAIDFVAGATPTQDEPDHIVIVKIPPISYRMVDNNGDVVEEFDDIGTHFAAKVRPTEAGWMVVEGDSISAESVERVIEVWESRE